MPKPLKIGIDVKDLQVAQTGTKTYLEELCKIFKHNTNPRYQFYFFDTLFPPYLGNNKLLKLLGHLRYQFWKQVSLPIKAWLKGVDVLFCTDNVVPMIKLGYKTIPVFHDAFFFESPEHFNKLWLKLTLATAIPAARRSPLVITPSRYARQQIHKYTNIAIEKMPVIYEGPKSLGAFVDSPSKNQFGKYILHVGVMNKRKNIPALIRAFAKVKQRGNDDLKLVLAGKIEKKMFSDDSEEINKALAESQCEQDIIFPGYLSDQELAAIYQHAHLYVFPSTNEGFGIPILEAFKYSLPVLVADNTALPEIGGEAVLTFDPFSIDDIAAKIEMALNNDSLRATLINKGRERLKLFSWEKTAESLLQEFERIQ